MKNAIVYKTYTFEDADIQTASLIQETSLPIDSLSIDTLEATIECTDDLSDYHQNDALTLYREGAPVNQYYLQELLQISKGRWTLRAVSRTGLLDQIQHRGGIYNGITAQELAAEICNPLPVIVKRDIANQRIYGYLGVKTARENLQQLLFALGANLVIDKNGVFRVQNLWNGISAYFTEDEIFSGAQVKNTPSVSKVTVLEHNYMASTDSKVVFSGQTYAGQVIVFNEPVSSVTGSGISIIESGANYAVVGAGSGTITGYPYIHTTREISVVVDANTDNEQRIQDATLVSTVNSAAVARRMADYYSARKAIEAGLLLRRREHTGQVARIVNPWSGDLETATLYDDDISLSTILRGEAKALIDFVPPQRESQNVFDTSVVLSGSGTFTVPDDVTSIAVILIGGGDGGNGGYNGEDGSQGSVTGTGTSASHSPGVSGTGGNGGTGGLGGKILQVDAFEVESGQTFAYSCGTGGNGGDVGGGTGTAGMDTTFGNMTSADGSRNSMGITDIITGIVYGASGLDGVKGGDGAASLGEQGGSVTFKGQTWVGGDSGGYNYHVYVTPGGEAQQYYIYGGLGGGAAVGESGGNANVDDDYRPLGKGGNGGNAITPYVGNYGSGGQGGHGGGGGGGGHAHRYNDSQIKNRWYVMGGGTGGTGSAGADGADGCVIVYYHISPRVSNGGLWERGNRYLLDKTNRLIVV